MKIQFGDYGHFEVKQEIHEHFMKGGHLEIYVGGYDGKHINVMHVTKSDKFNKELLRKASEKIKEAFYKEKSDFVLVPFECEDSFIEDFGHNYKESAREYPYGILFKLI